MTTDRGDMAWLLDGLVERAPGVRHVLVLSRDGLKMCFTGGLDEDRADQLAAIASGIQSLAMSASAEFGTALGAGQAMVEFPGGMLFVVPAGEGSHLAVLAGDETDVGLVAHGMNALVEQIDGQVEALPRRPRGDPAPAPVSSGRGGSGPS